jgi:hypothetical protein
MQTAISEDVKRKLQVLVDDRTPSELRDSTLEDLRRGVETEDHSIETYERLILESPSPRKVLEASLKQRRAYRQELQRWKTRSRSRSGGRPRVAGAALDALGTPKANALGMASPRRLMKGVIVGYVAHTRYCSPRQKSEHIRDARGPAEKRALVFHLTSTSSQL